MVESAVHHRFRDALLFAGIVILAALLRWYRIAEWDMWTDEVQTLWMIVTNKYILGPMYSTAPVSFWLTRTGIELFGENELGIRFVPWLAGVLTVASFLWISRHWLGRRVAILGGLFLTLAIWHVGWSQTGRHFALQTLSVLLALNFFLLTWLEKKPWGIWGSAVLLLIGTFMDSSTVFLLSAFLAFLGVGWLAASAGEADRRPRAWIREAIPYALVLLIYLPIFFGRGRLLMANKPAWNPPWNIIGSLLFYLPPWILLSALAGVFVLASRRQFHLAVLLALLFLVPVVLVTGSSSLTIAPAAYCLASLPALAMLVGVAGDWLLESATDRLQRNAATALIVGFFLSQGAILAHYYFVYRGLKPRWEEVSAYVDQRRLPREEFFAIEGDVARFCLGRGQAAWLHEPQLKSEPVNGAWFAVPVAVGPTDGASDWCYRYPQGQADLIQVFPIQYGAKDRTLALFRIAATSGGPDAE